MNKKSRSSKNDEQKFQYIPILVASLICSVLFFVFLIAVSAVMLNSTVNSSLYLPSGLVAGVLTGFINGFVTAKLTGEKGLLYGAVTGSVQSFLCAVTVFVLNKGVAGNGIFILIVLIISAAASGGLTAVNIRKKIKY